MVYICHLLVFGSSWRYKQTSGGAAPCLRGDTPFRELPLFSLRSLSCVCVCACFVFSLYRDTLKKTKPKKENKTNKKKKLGEKKERK